MARIKTEHCIMDGAEKKELRFSYEIHVTVDGLFYTNLPKHIVEFFIECHVEMWKNRRGNLGYVSAPTMPELVKTVTALAKESMRRKKVSETIVIKYAIQTTCSYTLDKKGNIYPNGYGNPDYEKLGWRQGTILQHAGARHPFGILIYAEPFTKVEYLFPSGKTHTEYNFIHFNDIEDQDNLPNLQWLSRINSIREPDRGDVKEIEYTEKIAGFFVNLIKGVCNLNERIKDFLEPDAIRALAEKGKNLLGQ